MELMRPQKVWNPDECEWWLKMKPVVAVMEEMLTGLYDEAYDCATEAERWFRAKKYAFDLLDRLDDRKTLHA